MCIVYLYKICCRFVIMDFISENKYNGNLDKKILMRKKRQKRKIRTNDEFIVTDLLSESFSDHLSKKIHFNNSLLPKVNDVSLVPIVAMGTSKILSRNKEKKANSMKIHKRKIEAGQSSKSRFMCNSPINCLKLKKAEGIWRRVKNVIENIEQKAIIRDVIIKVVPLEKTTLLSKDQLHQLQPPKIDNKAYLSNEQEIDCSDYYRKCSVNLTRLSTGQMKTVLKTSQNLHIVFNPQVTSSPNSFPNKSNNLNSEKLFLNRTSDKDSPNVIEVHNSPMHNLTISKPRCITGESVNDIDLLQFSNRTSLLATDLNRSYNVLPNQKSPTRMPKSMLKINSGRVNNNSRRVTFNNTSVIIIEDSNIFYESPVPTQFPSDDEDNGKLLSTEQSPTFNRKGGVEHTPTKLILKNCNSNSKFTMETVRKKTIKMPDYAKIHKGMYAKMLDIQEHNQQKLKRAQLLLSGHKPSTSTKKLNNKHVRTLTNALQKQNTLKRKLAYPNKSILVHSDKKLSNELPKKVKTHENSKISKSRKEQALFGINKITPLQNNLEGRKTEIKGVRSNRCFELQMNLRRNRNKTN